MATTINGTATTKFTLKRGEAKNLRFTYDADISAAVFALIITSSTGTAVVTKADAVFDKTYIAENIVLVNLSSADTDLAPATYNLEIKATWNALTSVDKSETLKMKIVASLFPEEA